MTPPAPPRTAVDGDAANADRAPGSTNDELAGPIGRDGPLKTGRQRVTAPVNGANMELLRAVAASCVACAAHVTGPRAPGSEPGHGSGEYVVEYQRPEPVPPPVTTIAWRLAHLIVGVFGQPAAAHFGGPPCDADTFGYAGTAQQALGQLDEAYAAWVKGVQGLGAEGLARPCGPAEGPFAQFPLASLVLHINREAIHHGAEICLLRDLYRDRG
jgi:hypothetical protein